ncbi:hypothetical protein JTE90_005043 [Oedothorax gibbosus]|uniref:BTB domain-containing protein n=1 Tax=Oedothorax gibbosus TaxID=931172 RepID=A0AAV6VCP4_9ARAC|nr:hypothetical protein JTE90_005043 [Oedothorax gibbosus]
MLQNNTFSDTLIGVHTPLKENTAVNQEQHLELPHLLHAHGALLKVRTPAFYNHLEEHQETNIGVVSYNSYLQEPELQQFLKKVYTDDDIRKHECEALHLSKKYIQLQNHNKSLVNKHILDVDEFEKESNHSACTDNFVTPITSPLSPDSKLNVLDMYGSPHKQANMPQNGIPIKSNTNHVNGHINHELHIDDLSDYPDSKQERIQKLIKLDSGKVNDLVEKHSRSKCSSKTSTSEDTNSDEDSEAVDFPMTGSMVRSNTFDLEKQNSLEDAAIDDSIEWCYRSSSNNDMKEMEDSLVKTNDVSPPKRSESSGFFLHDHSPSPKSNFFKGTFIKEPSFNSSQELESSSVHFRRLDGSMSDSGFMSHSTFSLDTAYSNSVTSSLIMSSDGITSSPVSITETNESLSERTKQLSGSMFPFYIDINNLPPPTPDSLRRKKSSSPSHTYMYIDARNHNGSPKFERPYLNTSYEEFFSRIEAQDQHVEKEPLTKAQSTPRLDTYRNENKPNEAAQGNDKFRPQSCYMFVDLDSVQTEATEKRSESRFSNQEQAAVAMFIDLDDGQSRIQSSGLNGSKAELWNNNSEKNQIDKDIKMSNAPSAGDQKRKLSDSFLSSNPNIVNKVNFSSLIKHRDSGSANSLNHQLTNGQETSQFIIQSTRKSKSAHRYSDGIYYDNLYEKKFINSGTNSLNRKTCMDPKSNHVKIIDQTFKLIQYANKNEESSGSCSNLGKLSVTNKLLLEDKTRWKSTGDMERPNTSENSGLLPMSPILRRKAQSKAPPEQPSPPIVVKASTKPQDVDAMKFPKPLKEEASKQDDIKSPPLQTKSPYRKKPEIADDSKSLSNSLKHRSNPSPSESTDTKLKNTDSMSRSGSSVGDSCSDRPLIHDLSKSKRNNSPTSMVNDFEDDSETIYSEVSDVSSFGGLSGVASLERGWRESQNPHANVSNQNAKNTRQMLEACSKLGEDLLKMFLEEIDTDIIVEVEGRQIKAHRCILAARGKYFANLLRTNNPEKHTSTISLEGFSYSAVHFALCHIYSGAMNIPKDCNISELALLADMLNLETLTDVIVFHLKMHYCHFFHRPCLQCSQGVVECLPLAAVCGLNELRDKCIYWLGKNFTRTWTTKSFAALSEELRDLCYNVTVHSLAITTVIDMTLNCDRLLTTLPQLKWTEPIFGMITKLLQDCIHFMATNFNQILNSEGFLALGKGQSWNVTALEEDIISSIELTTPDVACKSYDTVNRLILLADSIENTDYGEFTQNFIDLLHKISRHCERYLIQNANKVVHCQSWACLSQQVQKRIKDAAVIVFEFEKPTAPPPRLSSLQRKLKKQNEGEEFGCLERATYPKKGRAMVHNKTYQRESSPKNMNGQCRQESPERGLQRRESDNILKKIVSPIKEEVQYNSVENSLQDASYDVPFGQGALGESHYSPVISHRNYIDTHEEDSLRDLQDLPRDLTNHCEPTSESQMLCSVASLDLDDSRSPAQCSDNPDSLEVNEEISSDSKDDIDLSVSAEDGSHQEKGVNEKPEVLHKHFEVAEPSVPEPDIFTNPSNAPPQKPSMLIPVRDKTSLPQQSVLPLSNTDPNQEMCTNPSTEIRRDRSPIKKMGKSLLPLAKPHIPEEKIQIAPESKTKDLVAEIDADSRMVNHCLQEAEMLEQQLSRKLQRQHQDGTQQFVPNGVGKVRAPSDNFHRSSKAYGSRLQKASSTSQIKNLVATPSRGRSPGSKSNASSPSVGLPPRILRGNDSAREKARKASQSPKNGAPNLGAFRSVEGIPNVPKQLSSGAPSTPKRVSSRSNRTHMKVIAVRTSGSGHK